MYLGSEFGGVVPRAGKEWRHEQLSSEVGGAGGSPLTSWWIRKQGKASVVLCCLLQFPFLFNPRIQPSAVASCQLILSGNSDRQSCHMLLFN